MMWGAGLKRITKPTRVGFFILIIVAGGILAVVLLHQAKSKNNTLYQPISAQQVESTYDKENSKFLSNGDTESYEALQWSLAIQYLNNNDPNNAERVLLEVVNKVPENKIHSSTYMNLAAVEKAKGDMAKYKQYLQLAIPKLKTEGLNTAAQAVQNELDKTK